MSHSSPSTRSWPGAGGHSAKFIAREQPLRGWVLNGRLRASNSESWGQHYNAVRPHSSLGYLTPDEFKQQQQSATPNRAVLQE